MNKKDILYLLASKKYYIDNQETLILEDGYEIKIELVDDYKWVTNLDSIQPLCKLSLAVTVSNKVETYNITYKKYTYRNLDLLLSSPDDVKMQFILRKPKGLLKKFYREEVNEGNNKEMSISMEKAILKQMSKELQENELLFGDRQKKLEKICKKR